MFKKKRFNRRFHKNSGPKANNDNKRHQPRVFTGDNQLLETEVGITYYLSELEGFPGIIKARYSDFQVNEIDLNGEIAKLTDTKIPADFETKLDDSQDWKDVLVTPNELVPQITWDALRKLMEKTDNDSEEIELAVTELSKESRIEIRETLKKFFGNKIIANTKSGENDSKIMVFKRFSPKDKDNRFSWPADKGEYVHFLLYKEAIDTMEAVLKIGDCIGIAASLFNYAGVKDRRAKSTQWLSVRTVPPWKLIIKTKGLRNVKIGNIKFKEAPLKLGDLSGNKFRIALRNVNATDELINNSLANLKTKGFVNYYGLQRFGKDRDVPTYLIGKQLLLGNWKEACQIILKPFQSDDPESDLTKAKKTYQETGDAVQAFELVKQHKFSCIEYLLLQGLSKGHKNEFVNALESIPRNMRLLYIHSFQSLIWNSMVSKRLEKFGQTVVEGDMVMIKKQAPSLTENNECDKEAEKEEEKNQNIKILTSDDLENYTIYDVVLPLPGYDILYPPHLKEEYQEILNSHGLTLDMDKQKVQTYNVSGNYRKIVEKVQDLSWKIMRYSNPICNLILSDFEELKGHEQPEDLPDGKYKALVLEFLLSSSSYATMVLREILKTDTSNSSHAKLNNYHEAEKIIVKEPLEILKETEEEPINERVGLLEDTEKYEAFKNLIFNKTKRSVEQEENNDNNEDEIARKKSKVEDNSNVT